MGSVSCLSILLLLVVSPHLIVQTTGQHEDAADTMLGVSQWYRGVPHCITLAQSYRVINRQVTMLECGQRCAWNDRCYSFTYMDDQRRCMLNGAATAATSPPTEKESFVTFYHTSAEGVIVANLVLKTTRTEGLSRLTENNFRTQALAAAECGIERHLCELWEIEQSVKSGNPTDLPENTDMWYAVPDSQAKLTGVDVAQHGLPMVRPSPGVCCTGRQRTPQNPVVTPGTYTVCDTNGKASACAALAAHPCTLAELKAAHGRGYSLSTSRWYFYVSPSRDVRVFGDDCENYTTRPGECYEDTIANTPRPNPSGNNVYCCPNLYFY